MKINMHKMGIEWQHEIRHRRIDRDFDYTEHPGLKEDIETNLDLTALEDVGIISLDDLMNKDFKGQQVDIILHALKIDDKLKIVYVDLLEEKHE